MGGGKGGGGGGTAGSGARVTSLGLPTDLEPAAVPRHGPLPVQRGRVLLFQHSRRRQALQVRSPPPSRAWPPFPGESAGRGRRSAWRAEVRKRPEPAGGSLGGLGKPPGVPSAAGRVPEGSALRRCLNPAGDRGGGRHPAVPPPGRSGRGRPSPGRSFLLPRGAGLIQGTSVRLRARLGELNLLSFNHPVASAHRAHPARAGYLMEHVEAGPR